MAKLKGSRTGAQVHAAPMAGGALPARPASVDGILQRPMPWNRKVRMMRRDPTLKLARLLLAAPILASNWSYEASADAPAGAVDLIEKNLDPLRINLLDHTVRGWLDYGWAPFEKVYAYEEGTQQIRLKKLKPLLQDLTEILVEESTGDYGGLKQGETTLPVEETLTLYNEVEGTYWYGTPMMEPAEEPYDQWRTVNEAADRYDRRIAGTHWVIYYPTGESPFNGQEAVDNYEIAQFILNTLESSGRIVVPRVIDEMMMQLGQNQKESGWSIDLLSDNGSGTTSFVERMKYLDALKVRAMGLPERAILEGQFGTKAESEAQADFAITNLEMKHTLAAVQINQHCVDHLLELHFGPQAKGTVWIKPQPIADTSRGFLRSVYLKILESPDGFITELSRIDVEAMKNALGIPIDENGDLLDKLLADRRERQPDFGGDENEEDENEEEDEENLDEQQDT